MPSSPHATSPTPGPLDGRASAIMTSLCLLWSLQQISLKAAAADASPMTMIALRSAIAAALVAALMVWRGEARPALAAAVQQGRWRPGAVVGGLFALEYLLVAVALQLTSAGHVLVFLYTSPVFAALGLQARLPAERLKPLQWLGIGLAFAGIAIAFAGRAATHGVTGSSAGTAQILLGDALALLAGASWGATTVALRTSSLRHAPAAESLLYQLLAAFVLLAPAALLGGQWHFTPTAAAWGHLGFQSLIVSFASFLVWFWLLRHYLASRLGVFSFLTPVLGVVLGHALLGEPLETPFLMGGAFVLAGIGLVNGHEWMAGWRRTAEV
ncbi:DMT family transporter [Ideonella livida]|uniref:DMT family transporter n=1 Tax=Ideonella livida TaxID=2707176 RepID=A0A7C9TKY3_9BURK|nr:DMT family transporter [Ideonella livida]NDY92838.1 DMT family transporter [Ideonella livida]